MSTIVDKYAMIASVATIVLIFAVMLTAPSLGLVATGVMLAVNGVIMASVMRSD